MKVRTRNTKAALTNSGLALSATKTQALDELLVLPGLRAFEVVEQFAALIHELDEPAARRMIALVCGEMLAKSIDALGEQRDLHFRRAGIGWSAAELREDPAFFLTG
jgi:hypothetical protein